MLVASPFVSLAFRVTAVVHASPPVVYTRALLLLARTRIGRVYPASASRAGLKRDGNGYSGLCACRAWPHARLVDADAIVKRRATRRRAVPPRFHRSRGADP
ncbi:hypothetical protein MRX96_031034 [Rhipicephalus microplus]